jgi:ribosome recycling factor
MISDLKAQLQKSVDHLKAEFTKLQMGRASTSLVDELLVESYGSQVPLKTVANVSVPDAKTLRVEPWDKSLIADIEKGIREANIGLNPQNMGENLLIPIPPMTEERRKQTVKFVHEEAEKAKISARNIRQDFMKKVKNQKDEKEISEDEAKKLEKQIEEQATGANKQIDELSKHKEADILSI